MSCHFSFCVRLSHSVKRLLTYLLTCLHYCAANCRKVLHESEVERKLITVITQDKSISVQQTAVIALAVMAQNEASRDLIRKCGT